MTDFLASAAQDGVYIAFDPDAENKVLDLNDSPYADGFTETISIRAAQILGNGWTIRNLFFSGIAYVFQIEGTELDSLHLENVVASIPQKALLYTTSSLCWKNSSFSCEISTANAMGYLFYNTGEAQFVNCSFHVRFNGTMSHLTYRCVFDTCNLEVYFTWSSIPFNSTVLKSTVVRGRIEISGTGNKKIINGGSMESSYFAVQFCRPEGDTTEPCLWFYVGSYITTCFLDKDLLGEGISFITNNTNAFLGLTTSQCEDAAYLSSIGFPCVEVGV